MLSHWILPLVIFPLGPLAFLSYQIIQFKKGNDKVFAYGATLLVSAIAALGAVSILMFNLGYWA